MNYQIAELPEDLTARGWKQVGYESTVHRLQDIAWYAMVFRRAFDPGIDDDASSLAVRMESRTYIRVSTNTARSTSWDAAYVDALDLMRAADSGPNVALPE